MDEIADSTNPTEDELPPVKDDGGNLIPFKYYHKECYVHHDTNLPDAWRDNINGKIIIENQALFFGSGCDLGCNSGAFTLLIAAMATVNSIVGVDIFYTAIRRAFELACQFSLTHKARFVLANLAEKDALIRHISNCDFCVTFHTLEHIYPEDAGEFIRNIRSILKIGGTCFISIPYDHAYGSNEHVAWYKELALSKLFEENGFITKKCYRDLRGGLCDVLTGIFERVY